jgi:beta-lactamase regulating signal transducer with metallopeptidase domain
MLDVVYSQLASAPWIEMLELFIDVTLKGAIICTVASIATLLLRRSSAFTRNMIWVFALVGLILLPVFSLLSPVWNLPILPELGSWGSGSYNPEIVKMEPARFVGPVLPASAASGSPGLSDDALAGGLPWYAWCMLAWLAGGLVYLGWWLFSQAGVRHLVKDSQPAKERWTRLLESVTDELDLHRQVELLESWRIKAAITVGIFNPIVVVPADTRDWPANRRRLVLSHELAHVKRWDTLIEAFALMVTVFYWVNPFVWFAVRQLRIERERDCDNAVLSAGAKPSDYAELLLNIAADLGGSAKPIWRMSTISQSSNLKDRLMSILNQKINRNQGSRRSAILTGALVLALALPISTSGLWNVQAEEKSKKDKKAQTEEMKKKEHDEKMKQKQKEEEMKKKEIKKGIKKTEMSAEEKEKYKKMSAKEKITMSWEKVCSQEGSAACEVGAVIKKKGVDAGLEYFNKLKQAGGDEYYFEEKEFNTPGYMFLYHGKTDQAISVFKLNVKEYPESWNVYDSLGEAYLAAKKYDQAKKYYSKALDMNPKSESSQKALKKIKSLEKEVS